MKFLTKSTDPLKDKTDLLVVLVPQEKPFASPFFKKLNKAFGNHLEALCKKTKFEGKSDQTKLIATQDKIAAQDLLLVGLGPQKNLNLETLRKAGAKIQAIANANQAKQATLNFDKSHFKGFKTQELAQAFSEGVILSSYQFNHYKKSDPKSLETLTWYSNSRADLPHLISGANFAQILCGGVGLARDLVNGPGADVTPKKLATTAQSLKGVQAKIYNLAAIRKMKMGAFLSVGEGSTKNPPYFIELTYQPKGKSKKKIAIVGKGVTFDSGGYSLKPPPYMETMKSDMAGAAAVLALFSILPQIKPHVEVRGYIAATENMVDGFAQRPGDICTAMNGKTIEVLNTDAEGRLTLADALYYASQKKPDYLIDMATLTGSCVIALGDGIAGLMGNDKKLIEKLKKTSEITGEDLWPMPLHKDYDEELKSNIADFRNIGNGREGGTLIAGLFLQHFVGDVSWAHIDIAGPAWTNKDRHYLTKGGTGFMVRTLVQFLTTL